MLGLLLVPIGALAVLVGVVLLVVEVVRGRRRVGVVRVPIAIRTAAVLAAVPAWFIAIRWAEASSGWVDSDKDGMLDGFSNGAYDWVDLNGDDFGITWTFLVVAAVVAAEVAVRRWRGAHE